MFLRHPILAFKHKMKSWGVDYAKHEQEKNKLQKLKLVPKIIFSKLIKADLIMVSFLFYQFILLFLNIDFGCLQIGQTKSSGSLVKSPS